MVHHKIAYDCGRQIAPRINHDNIAHFSHVEGFMYHEIVARSCLHRQRRTSELALQMHGSQSWASGCHAGHGVAYVRDRQPSELFNLLNVRPTLAFQNSEANRHYFLLCFGK
jgi:hypothetical protein